jgi:hypothetical protein
MVVHQSGEPSMAIRELIWRKRRRFLGSAERIVGPRRLTGGVSVDFEIAAAVRCLMWSYLV